jgi:hypothetical protein
MNNQKFFSTRKVSVLNCPACSKVGTLHKSKTRNVKEAILKNLFFWGYFRCWDCDWRGLMFKKNVTKETFNLLLLYAILAICSALIGWAILGRIVR